MVLRIVRKENPLPRDAAEWLHAVSEAVQDMAPETLGCELAGVTSYRGEQEPAACGALLPVSGDEENLQVGLFCSPVAARELAAAFLSHADPESLNGAEIADALGEILNSWMSTVLVRLSVPTSTLRLGLPLFVSGPLQAGITMERSGLSMKLGPTPIQLVLVRRAH